MKWFKEYSPLIVSILVVAIITLIVKYSDML